MPGPVADERVTDGRDGEYADIDTVNISEAVADALTDQGIGSLYRHQADAISAVNDEDNVVIATATASGKSVCYTVPALEAALSGKTVLYVAPTTALINDQADTLKEYAEAAGLGAEQVARYTGQLSRTEKKDVREAQPRILLTTVDMLHMSLLPYARQRTWDWFFSDLDLVVIDELHMFRGVFGSHVSLVFRRLQRMVDVFGQRPRAIACSATIGNPVEHATKVTGFAGWELFDEDTSAAGPKHWVVADNDGSSHTPSKVIMTELVQNDTQAVAFTRARQGAERYAELTKQELRDADDASLANRVMPYHAALNDVERREAEASIRNGDALGVWSTNALEVGVDVGSLDAAVIDGYPGSRMEVHQQAGRAGRGTDTSYVFLVPGNDSLDQHIASHPDKLFEEAEQAQVNPANAEILPRHLGQAAKEQPLTGKDAMFFPAFRDSLEKAERKGFVRKDGDRWTATEKVEGRPFGLRNVSDRSIALVDGAKGERITELPYESAIQDAYPDAIYMHRGQRYEVENFKPDDDVAYLQPLNGEVDYYTQPQKQKRIEVKEELAYLDGDRLDVYLANVRVHGNVTGYFKKSKSTNKTIQTVDYGIGESLPFSFNTRAIGFSLKDEPGVGVLADGLHAAEHTMIGVLPLHVLCDRRNDLGGLSIELHSHTGEPSIFIHEGHEGGVGLVDTAFDELGEIIEEALATIMDCDCIDGCGSCIYSPTCGNANEHLDKQDGEDILRFLREELPTQE